MAMIFYFIWYTKIWKMQVFSLYFEQAKIVFFFFIQNSFRDFYRCEKYKHYFERTKEKPDRKSLLLPGRRASC